MSWLVSIGQRAREAAGAVGNVGGAARAALSSVTSFADDRARRLGQAVRARVLHGRHVMMDDAVARLERAVAECEPAQRPAMLRRWLATIRATSEPTSETPTTTNDAPADDASGADERKRDKNDDDDAAADADKWASLEVAAGERADAARAGAEQDSAAAPSRGAHSPVDAFGLLPSDGAAVPIRDEGDAFEGDVVEGAVEGAAALTFRDVVLRSGALEALVLSYVDAPSSGDVETSLLVELLRDALMFDVDDAVDDDDTAVEESVVVEGGASRSAASRLVASLAAATDAIRAQGDAEVQLGAAELRAVVAAAVGAAKKIGGVEALANRERRLRRELASIARAARDGAFGAGGADLAAALADLAGGVDEDERRSGRSEKDREDGREEGSPTGKRLERSEGFAAPELAAATRRAVDVARTAHESAHARRVRLDAELSGSVSGASGAGAGAGRSDATAEALGTLRAAAETLARAGADADVLSRQSRAQLLDAESFRERKSAELRAAEDAVSAESDRLATRVAELRDELARTERKAEDAAARARLAADERTEFEEAHGAVRGALKSKVSDLDRRVREYAAESAAVEAVAVCVGAVAEHRKNALKTLASDAKIDEARAWGAYVASVAAHARGQAGAARLCLDRCVHSNLYTSTGIFFLTDVVFFLFTG